MKYFLLLFLIPAAFAQTSKGLDKMLELMNQGLPLELGKGFSGKTLCPEMSLRLKSIPNKEIITLNIFLDEDENRAFSSDEPNGSVIITKKNSIAPMIHLKSKRKQFNFKTHKDSILYFTSDFNILSGTFIADYEDLKAKKTYKNCVYYVRQELKK